MRSFHRYASDAMVLAMVLHLVRHFAFDQYRSFRWFSWVSGVILLWLVYISGINGYMLPWDAHRAVRHRRDRRVARLAAGVQRARWCATSSRPTRSTTGCSRCCRSCTSACRSACSALLWVHTQRVPGAKTHPAAPDLDRRHARAARAVARQAGAVRAAGRPRRRADDDPVRLVLPAGLPADLRVVARRGVGARRRADAAAGRCCRGCRRSARRRRTCT